MKLVAKEWFYPAGVARVVRPGEAIQVQTAVGRRLVQQGLAVPRRVYPEMAVRAARERAVAYERQK